ncbi:unnamed protein product [Citrullus colocynthis]|uniref:Uncharacterized protein n=1 Tax=Citrullus colocynthis TaxID=252529 RepID=A0ABP0YCS4_9ROSI
MVMLKRKTIGGVGVIPVLGEEKYGLQLQQWGEIETELPLEEWFYKLLDEKTEFRLLSNCGSSYLLHWKAKPYTTTSSFSHLFFPRN